ncbi:MAG: filamentous hemagglutinin N-terminal domain-containing protein [Cyanobacteria bacterium SID2]|nr:filamentous hemagglutinin N-terminal domain-containing protein [Cyanobacteria bacterium SID2]
MAQIAPDTTLSIPSQVTVEDNIYTIEGGVEVGSNLFHSFEDFSVPTGAEAFFNNASTIDNILTRVTGGQISNIDGLIRANGTANLFLLNPNGIVFGENARLEIGGSFFASTAHRLELSDGSFFSATEPETPLLTVSVPVGVQLGNAPGSIDIRGSGLADRFELSNSGLSVKPGRSIALLGGNITLNGGIVSAPSGRVEIGGVLEGAVGFDEGLTFDYDSVSEWGDVQFLNRSSVVVPTSDLDNAPNTGIQIVGRQIALDGSQIATLTQNHQASGSVDIQASELLRLGGSIDIFPFSASIETQVSETATGNGGNLNVTSPRVEVGDGARIETLSFGSGNAGDVTVNADSIQIIGSAPSRGFIIDPIKIFEQTTNSRISSETFGGGEGGNVNVITHDLYFNNSGQIRTLTGSEANGGTINVNARDLSAENSAPLNPFVSSGISSLTTDTGIGGDINVTTQRATLQDGAQISARTLSAGLGGSVRVRASESIAARGVSPTFSFILSGVFADVLGSGDGGTLSVTAPQLTLSEGGGMTSFVLSQIAGSTLPGGGLGNAGDVNIVADSIELLGVSPLNPENFTQMGSVTFGVGDAGDVRVSARQIQLRDGAVLVSSVVSSVSIWGDPVDRAGTGNSGQLHVDVSESLEVFGTNPVLASATFVGTQTFGIGSAGDFTLNTDRLLLRDGGSLGSFTSATGNAGQIQVNASEIVIRGRGQNGFRASTLAATAFEPDESLQQAFFIPDIPTGNTGNVTIQTDRLILEDGGGINVRHDGIGNAGRLDIDASEIVIGRDARITATTAFGVGGDVALHARESLQLHDNGTIALSALGDVGNGGNLSIEAGTISLLDRNTIQANALRGSGGNIRIATEGIFTSPQSSITASSQLGIDGIVEITQPTVDTRAAFVQLNNTPIDPTTQIVSACGVARDNSFIVTGNGGLPPDPTAVLRGQTVWVDTRLSDEIELSSSGEISADEIEESSIDSPPVEATGWKRHENGLVELVVTSSTQQENRRVRSPCHRDL